MLLAKMDQSSPPEATIVIVAWRLVDELGACLDAVAASVEAPSFEVIVVLNGASSETEAVARNHPIVTSIITRRANIGFGGACNIAAASASGRHLVFLNDDTEVDGLWLKTIVAAANHDDTRGAVASLLLNLDGTVQEAGARILPDGETFRFGMNLPLAEVRSAGLIEPRPVDYGSAAALLIRRDAFEKIGGFDELFAPAYFEDVDLQLRLREIGLHVWFEPAATVVHLLGRSTDNDHWFRHYAVARSGLRFAERWAPALSTAAAVDAPVSELCQAVRSQRPSVTKLAPADTFDDSPMLALRIAHDYQNWLSNKMDGAGVPIDPNAPSRVELLELVGQLRARVDDLERRGPFGVVKMRLGVMRRQFLQSRSTRATERDGT
jgi:GT2 family glycosyltransferase